VNSVVYCAGVAQNGGMFRRLFLAAGMAVLAVGLSQRAGASKAADLVDLNRASVVELMRMPGITAVWAGRIVRFRPYKSKLDLLNEGVVSAEVYGRIRDRVVAHRGGTSESSK
jgi:DNA uptake protein ComE-like DNA-binding protein